ncbi:beta-lactamase family protein [Amycolatopsis acidiphila]|uniref:Beta-lactamase family protein n=1 Tax=Amycolatopsis acidiphila TaxID=715473 RepID=A0A558A897_9PSEU|nr:serine hydrolase domain-containing protein [Amycolatopsis acidiphila]TVT20483.1 beta-lactamase family protein [Amycolatopsis acidiphila]UIJ57008.1 beta-lactamase family protein [Amycolatopsis acidiphila]GHG53860.1 serine hydrolase [Amycolatopsis acidiphila]
MTDLHTLLGRYVDDGTLPGAVGLVARGDEVEVAAVGSVGLGETAPMARDSIFRIASITKCVTAAAVLMLVEDGQVALDDPVARWLPELAAPAVVRTPDAPVDDVVPAARPITVADLLTSTAGYGFASDFSLPAVQRLFPVQKDGREPQTFPGPDEWLAELAKVPLAYQPGEGWLYDTCSTLQGVLVGRACGQSFPDFLAERVFAPLGMADSGFVVPESRRPRFTSFYKAKPDGGLVLADAPDGQWSTEPALPLGNGGLAGTADDLLAFGRMLLAGGTAPDGRRVLSAGSVRLMTTDHTRPAHREIGRLFLEGQGWGMGGSVDIAPLDPWNVPGRYGWVGGTGTSAHVVPSTGTVAILLTQVGVDSPVAPGWMRDFWRYSTAS